MFEVLEHTADVGLRVRSENLNALFREGAVGLFSLIVEDLGTIQPKEDLPFKLSSPNVEDLLFDWIAELIYTFDTRHVVLRDFDVDVQGAALMATAHGEPLDTERHTLKYDVKAVTYHQFKLTQAPHACQAQFILDL